MPWWTLIFVLSGQPTELLRIDDRHEEPVFEPEQLAFDEERLVIADQSDHRVKVYDRKTGAIRTTFGRNGQGPGEFQRFGGLAITDSAIFVFDKVRNQLMHFTHDGVFQGTIANVAAFEARVLKQHLIGFNMRGEQIFKTYDFKGKEQAAFGGPGMSGQFTPKKFVEHLVHFEADETRLYAVSQSGTRLAIIAWQTGQSQIEVALDIFDHYGVEATMEQLEPQVLGVVNGSPVRDMVSKANGIWLLVRNEQVEQNPTLLIQLDREGRRITQRKTPFQASALFNAPGGNAYLFSFENSVLQEIILDP